MNKRNEDLKILFCDNCQNIMYPIIVNKMMKFSCKICYHEKDVENNIYYSKDLDSHKIKSKNLINYKNFIHDNTLKRVILFNPKLQKNCEFVLINDSNMRQIQICSDSFDDDGLTFVMTNLIERTINYSQD